MDKRYLILSAIPFFRTGHHMGGAFDIGDRQTGGVDCGYFFQDPACATSYDQDPISGTYGSQQLNLRSNLGLTEYQATQEIIIAGNGVVINRHIVEFIRTMNLFKERSDGDRSELYRAMFDKKPTIRSFLLDGPVDDAASVTYANIDDVVLHDDIDLFGFL